ncbi:MAG: winged helix-turn-helix transcriptional regulator [Anaerolineae bacterium]|nr:winged helix-turn-helix transcriptional regulator [Anaerolineae bacterium]
MDEKLVTEIYLLHEQVCSALGNPHRLLILYALHEQPRYVTDLAEVLDIPQSSVSRHLKVLRDRGLVVTRREGPAVYYALGDTRVIDALELLREMLYDRIHKQVQITDGQYRGKRRARAAEMP